MNIIEQFFTGVIEFFTSDFKIGETYVSLLDLLQIILWLMVVILLTIALKNLLKHRLLKRIGIEDEGDREAIGTLISYSIGTLGFVILLSANGLTSIGLLAGGLGFGIGLGLQEIAKNFSSGLTLLLERKLKVGHFVEFDGLSGYIKEVSLRSTVIRTREGGDVVVPNSHIVENRIINWTYDSYVARIDLPVGVAYGSDTVLVTETLLKSAYMEPTVVSDPAPEVLFRGFGNSSLDFELRVWVNRIDREPKIRSSLNFIIEYNLNQQGITIPFPQRDLWLRNPEVLDSFLRSRESSQLTPASVQSLPAQLEQPVKPLSIRDLLRKVAYFENWSDLELRQLIEVGYRKRLQKSEVLFRENDPGDAFYIILSGSVEVYVEKINKHLTTLGIGQFFGELALMLGIPRTATVRTLEDSLLFVINHKGFRQLLLEHPELSEQIVQALGQHQEELQERQKQLREMGLVDEAEDDKNPVIWVRKRLQNLFNL